MSKQPPAGLSTSRIRCGRCSRFVFRGDVCRCTRGRAPVYEPHVDGVVPRVRLTLTKDVDVYVTARHHTPLDQDGNWSSAATFGTRDWAHSEANEERFS